MRTPVDPTLVQEATRFRLRFGCADCVYHDPEQMRCSECFPNAEHLAREVPEAGSVVFCKRFELL